MKILNDIKLILDDQGNHLDSYTISLESFRSFRGPLFCKPVNWSGFFFAASYSKPALGMQQNIKSIFISCFRYLGKLRRVLSISWISSLKMCQL